MNQIRHYRGMRVDTKEWIYGFATEYNGRSYIKPKENNGRFGCGTEVIPSTVGQYTWLKDKNGKEIFEGDDLRTYNNSQEAFVYGTVFFDSGSFMLCEASIEGFKRALKYCSDGVHDWFSMEQYEEQELEIIGNIHEGEK